VSPERSAERPHEGLPADLHVLRAKYLDYCSAQIADLIVLLSPDDIYVVAERATREKGAQYSGNYGDAVRAATQWISDRLALPPFEVWLEDYEAHPQRYEDYLLGLWKGEATRAS
jgi:hypothetical protein